MQHRLPTYVEADLAATPLSAALAGSWFDAASPAVFTCEGLLYYLPPVAVDALLADWATIAAAGVCCPTTVVLSSSNEQGDMRWRHASP